MPDLLFQDSFAADIHNRTTALLVSQERVAGLHMLTENFREQAEVVSE